jgi:hypothetical protein
MCKRRRSIQFFRGFTFSGFLYVTALDKDLEIGPRSQAVFVLTRNVHTIIILMYLKTNSITTIKVGKRGVWTSSPLRVYL